MNMSLHPIAEAVRSQGRNGDSMLVHMTPGEVAALQRMAETNGGTLTINPETGQPEAFFLAALLPALAGAAMPGIAAATGIAALANPLTSSLLIGGLTGAITGDMKQGLMAGLGAYGGFGLGESLMGAAAPAVTTPAVAGAGAVAPVAPVAPAAVAPGGMDIGLGALERMGLSSPAGTAPVGSNIFSATPTQAFQNIASIPNTPETAAALKQLGLSPAENINLAQNAVQTAAQNAPITGPAAPGIQNLRLAETARGIPYGSMSGADMMSAVRSGSGTVSGGDVISQMGRGLQSVTGSGEAAMNFAKNNIGNIATAAAPMMVPSDKKEETGRDTTQYQYLDFDPGQLSPEQIAAQYADRPGTTAERLYRQVSYGPRSTREVVVAKGGQIPGYQYGGIPEMMPRGFENLGRMAQQDMEARDAARAQQGIIPTALGAAGMNPVLAAVAGAAAAQKSNMPAVLAGYMGATQAPAPVTNASIPYSGSGLNVSGGDSAPSQGDGVSYGAGVDPEVGAMAGGGLAAMSYKRGGLKEDSFIVPADVLAALGNGSNNAGLAALNKMLAKVGAPRAEKIDGPGDGMSDSIPTSIEGRQPARVAKDEAYVPTEAVRRLGSGDVKKGAKKLYDLMARVRKAAHGNDKQQRRVNPDRLARA